MRGRDGGAQGEKPGAGVWGALRGGCGDIIIMGYGERGRGAAARVGASGQRSSG